MPFSDPTSVGPFWRERQLDPRSPDFVPAPGDGATGATANVTHRNGTLIGTLGSGERAIVDPRGLLTPLAAGWSVDWWIGAEDRWHVPSQAPVVRQRLLDHAPVVETALRVPGGDTLARAYGMHSTTTGPCAVLEVENRSAVPVAVAIAIRPYHGLGDASVSSIELAGTTLLVDGRAALLLPKAPPHAALCGDGDGDAAAAVFAGTAPAAVDRTVRSRDGRATAALVFPLAHTAVLRVVVPLAPPVAARRGRAKVAPEVVYPDALPSAAQVAAGWEVQTRRGLQLQLPDQRLDELVATARRHLLLAHAGDDLASWPPAPFDFAAANAVLEALDVHGFHDEAAELLRTWPARQALDGTFVGAPGRLDANGAALAAVARHWRLTRDAELVDGLIGPVAKGAHWIEKKRTNRRAPRDPEATGLLPIGAAPGAGGPPGAYLHDDAGAVVALEAISEALAATGQPEVAADAARFAGSLRADLDAAVHRAASRAADGGAARALGAVPATPSRGLDDGIVVNLDLARPYGPYAPDEPAIAATLDVVRERLSVGAAVFEGVGPAGLSPALTLQLATVELEAGDRRALDRIAWLIDAGGPTAAWPTTIHPRTGGGSSGAPHDPVATARLLTFVRRLLVREVVEPDGRAGLALCTLVPDTWLGQQLDVREAPTAFGTLSFAVRWHGDRPALLWEVLPHDGVTDLVLTAPGLDPSWSTRELKGEALLAPVPVPKDLKDRPDGERRAEPSDGPDPETAAVLKDGPDGERQAEPSERPGGDGTPVELAPPRARSAPADPAENGGSFT